MIVHAASAASILLLIIRGLITAVPSQQQLVLSADVTSSIRQQRRRDIRLFADGTFDMGVFKYNVGDRVSIEYFVNVLGKDGKIVCTEKLVPTKLSIAEPEEILFSQSSYIQQEGFITPMVYTTENPFNFIPWYGGLAEVTITGMGCKEYHSDEWIAKDTLKIRQAVVKVEEKGCITQPSIQDGMLTWQAVGQAGCRINFHVDSALDRTASYGALQLLLQDTFYLIIENKRIHVANNADDDEPVLDAPTTDVAHDGFELPAGNENIVRFTDSPGMTLGKGCWSSPSHEGTYTGLGFSLQFQTFVMQDYDGIRGEQVPIGGDAVLWWGIEAQATLDNGAWTVNSAKSGVTREPEIDPKSPNFMAEYNNYAQNSSLQLANYNKDTGCYVFTKDFM
ncbi:hypothetical protein BGZ79_004408 [Entomortierella chlamydospora]|nr:hypothetical protein BGZ79_004408 [Entomortierella chlamydospora]